MKVAFLILSLCAVAAFTQTNKIDSGLRIADTNLSIGAFKQITWTWTNGQSIVLKWNGRRLDVDGDYLADTEPHRAASERIHSMILTNFSGGPIGQPWAILDGIYPTGSVPGEVSITTTIRPVVRKYNGGWQIRFEK